ncbi:MAG: trypsin-like peptidase domain-containing protein [Oscillospiraceae bacterium]|nr:trypsin-like peptidase domain-containing protein [Oscillospiraceae bacterium]
MKITGISAFGDVRGRTAGGVRSVYFVLCEGYYSELVRDITELDRRLSSDERCIYRRITEIPVPDVKESARYGEKWDRLRKGEAVLSAENAHALERVCGIYKAARGNISPSIEKNLAVTLMFRSDKLLEGMCPSGGKCSKLVCSGKIGYKEYLFCLMAAFMGIDVMLLCPSELPSLPEGMERHEERIISGALSSGAAIPAYQPVSQTAAQNAPVQPIKSSARAPRLTTPERHIPLPAPSGTGTSSQRTAVLDPPRTEARSSGERSFEELATLASSVVMITIHNKRGKPVGSGSGIAIGKDGYILTNFHVTGTGGVFSVQLENDESIYRTSEIIKYHPELDLAVLRIDRELIPLKMFSGREELRRGQSVVAIGSPLGLFNTVSDGIISGFRKINGVEMIQFTAPISGGSSGGALLNMHGEVIGISTAGFSRGQNLNLAVSYKDIIPFIGNFIK